MGTTHRFHNDFETFSEVDLKKCGSSVYARHPSTEILMQSYATDDGEVAQWVPLENIGPRTAYSSTERYRKALLADMPLELKEAIRDPSYFWFAWNKSFEYQILLHVAGIEIPHHRWRDPMVLALTLSFPGALDAVGTILNLPPELRKKAGMALINKFSKPRKPTKTIDRVRNMPEHFPAAWNDYKVYNRNDTVAERACWLKMRPFNMPPHEWKLWYLDQEINEAGIPINLTVANNAVAIADQVVEARMEEMREITKLSNPNSTEQLLPWLQDGGYPYDDLKKGHVKRAASLAEELGLHEDTSRVLQLRSEVSKSSVKKFTALTHATDADGFLRHGFQFAGAQRTWRWGGRKFQAQNLARPEPYLEHLIHMLVDHLEHLDAESIEMIYEYPMDVLSACVRPVVQAKPGYLLLDADLNAIENRVLGWMTGCDKILDVFRNGRDPYIDFATYLYGEPYADLWHQYKVLKEKTKRTVAKPGVLGCGYMLSAGHEFENERTGEIEATGLLGYAWNMGVKLTLEQSQQSVDVFRSTYLEVPDYWDEIDQAARRCISTGKPTEAGPVEFDRYGPFMRMRLPSGRYLHYYKPSLQMKAMPRGKKKLAICYEGLNDKKKWGLISTHPGKLTENADQAISRDLLAHGMQLARAEGIDIRLHVHDQIVAMAPEDEAEDQLKLLIECMEQPPKWAPDLPLGAEGFVDRIFRKD